MSNNESYVGVGKPRQTVGAVYSAPLGSTSPTDASSALADAFKDWGFISEDGINNTIDEDFEDVRAFGGVLVRRERTSRAEQFVFRGIEENAVTLTEWYGEDNVSVSGDAIEVIHNDIELPYRMFVFNIALTKTRIKRIFVPKGQISKLGENNYDGTNPVGREVTIDALKDVRGNTAYEWIEEV